MVQSDLALGNTMITHSATRVQTWRRCRRKWFLSEVAGLRNVETEAQARGKAFHKELENWFLSEGDILPESPAARAIASTWPSPGLTDYESEVSFREEIDGVIWAGKVDLIQYMTDGPVVGDHKTVWDKKGVPNSLRDELQPNLYLKAMQGQYTRWVYAYPTDKEKTKYGITILELDAVNESVISDACRDARQIEADVATGELSAFPENRKACFSYGRCEYFDICWKTPEPQRSEDRRKWKRRLEIISEKRSKTTTNETSSNNHE